MTPFRRTLIVSILAGAALVGCGRSADTATATPRDFDRSTSCTLDGMLLADYPGPKAQIFYAGQDAPDFFCDTIEMFHVYLTPEEVKKVRGIFVQDMGKTPWDEPRGHWIDARSAFYVYGSKREGSMGPTIASFAQQQDATKFAAQYGGKVYRFGDITPDMVVLDGGVLNDRKM